MLIPVYDPVNTTTETRQVKKMVPVTVMQEVTEEVTETVPVKLGAIAVYPVQYRNYPGNVIHIQHAGDRANRYYGFAFNFPGQATSDVKERFIPSLAGTNQVYAYGSLVVSSQSATLVGVNNISYNVPFNTLPF